MSQIRITLVCPDDSYADKVYEKTSKWFRDAELESFMNQAGFSMKYIEDHGYICSGRVRNVDYEENKVYIDIEVDKPYVKMWKPIVNKHWSSDVKIFFQYEDFEKDVYLLNDPSQIGKMYVFSMDAGLDGVYDDEETLVKDLLEDLELCGICPENTDLNSLKQEYEYLGFDLEIYPYKYISIEDAN